MDPNTLHMASLIHKTDKFIRKSLDEDEANPAYETLAFFIQRWLMMINGTTNLGGLGNVIRSLNLDKDQTPMTIKQIYDMLEKFILENNKLNKNYIPF